MDDKIEDEKQSISSAGHFDRHGGAPVWYEAHCSMSDVACPGLLQKPLDAAIRQLLTPYCPVGRQGENQHNDDAKYPPFASHFDGRVNRPVLYPTHRPMEVIYGFHKSH